MNKRWVIVISNTVGALCALAVIWLTQTLKLPFLPPQIALPGAGIVPGLVLIAMIGRLMWRRFFDDEFIDGQDFTPGTAAWIDQRVLSNTAEQLLLCLVVWPFVALLLGGVVVLVLGMIFAVARVCYWVGYHVSLPLRGFGFAMTFYPTVLAAIWSVLAWAF